jgi:hypothetical protein
MAKNGKWWILWADEGGQFGWCMWYNQSKNIFGWIARDSNWRREIEVDQKEEIETEIQVKVTFWRNSILNFALMCHY